MSTPEYRQGEFCWFEHGTRDAAAAKAFYAALFGWTADDTPMPGGTGTYTMLRLGGKDVGGLYEMGGPEFEGVQPHWLSYVWVDDVDTTVAKVEGLGGKLMRPPMDVPGVGQMASVIDPTGAILCARSGLTDGLLGAAGGRDDVLLFDLATIVGG